MCVITVTTSRRDWIVLASHIGIERCDDEVAKDVAANDKESKGIEAYQSVSPAGK